MRSIGAGSSAGIVESFDEFIGLGSIKDSENRVWPFHCISLDDGTRTIEVGVHVVFSTEFRVAREEAVHIIRQ